MPFANYKVPQGTLTAAQKEEIIHKTTDLLCAYMGEQSRPHTMVLIDEVVDGGYGRADEVFTLATLAALMADATDEGAETPPAA